jgi:hypothetical protein
MHMVLVMLGGVLLLGVFLLFGWLWGHGLAGSATGAQAFVAAWLVVATGQYVGGCHRAGYIR